MNNSEKRLRKAKKRSQRWSLVVMEGRHVRTRSLGRRGLYASAVALSLLGGTAGWAIASGIEVVNTRQASEAMTQTNNRLRAALEEQRNIETSLRRQNGEAEFLLNRMMADAGIDSRRETGPIGPVGTLKRRPQASPTQLGAPEATLGELRYLADSVGQNVTDRRRTPSVTPTPRATLTSTFGYRIHPLEKIRRMHSGIDLGARLGTPVLASADGQVVFAGFQPGYGQTVILDHGRGIQTHYAHLSRIGVGVGDKVRRHDSVGDVGETGAATGPHLHYEVRERGKPQDPQEFIQDR